jgi:hypothetical protein
MPLDPHIAGRHGERQAGLQIRPAPMPPLLDMTNKRAQRAYRLPPPTVFPRAARTPFAVAGRPRRGMAAGGAQDAHPPIHLLPQPWQGVVRHLGGGTRPPHNHPPLVEPQPEFPTNNPAVLGEAWATARLGAAACTPRRDQREAVGVDAAEPDRGGQESPRPRLLGREERQEPGRRGQAGQQRPIVARQPALKGPVPHPLQGMQQAQGDALTRSEGGCGVLGDGAPLLSALVEQGSDQLPGEHTALRSWAGWHREQRGGVVERPQGHKRKRVVWAVLLSLYGW